MLNNNHSLWLRVEVKTLSSVNAVLSWTTSHMSHSRVKMSRMGVMFNPKYQLVLRRSFNHWLTVMQYLWHKWPYICSPCRKHFQVLSSRQDLNRTAKICSGKLTNTMVHLTRARIFVDCFGGSVQLLFSVPCFPFLWLSKLLPTSVPEERYIRSLSWFYLCVLPISG